MQSQSGEQSPGGARVGVAGLGKMGAAMAARLVDQGFVVQVWNRTRARADASGLPVADTPRALAAECDVILTALFDAEAFGPVFHGADGLLKSARGKLFIEMSTVRPQEQVALANAIRDAGGAHIECPVGGTTGPARAGTLLGLVGGDAEALERARPVLNALCRRVEHVGPTGAGAAMKLAINLPLLVFYQALGESLSLVRHLGLDPTWLMALYGDTSGGANVLKNRGSAIAGTVAGTETPAVTFDIDSIRKDLRTMVAEAEGRGFSLPVAAQALAVFDQAGAAGWGERDGTWLPAFWPSHGNARADT